MPHDKKEGRPGERAADRENSSATGLGLTIQADGFAVPPVLRGYGLVPRQRGSRRPARVLPSAFARRGLPVPERPGRRNAYQLTGGHGFAWSAELDAYVARCGAELAGQGELVLVDIDAPLAVDGTPMLDGLRWLADRAGGMLDLSACLSVRTPGHQDRGHGPGWHLWYAADPDRPVRTGALSRCRAIEIKTRGTCPGSPGYVVRSAPAELPPLPGWLAELAGPPRERRPSAAGGGSVRARLEGVVNALLSAGRGERNRLLHWAAARCGEMVTAGLLDAATARKVLADAAAETGLRPGEAAATIESGLGGAR